MPRLRSLFLFVVLVCGLVTGCAAGPVADAPVTPVAQDVAAPAPGSVAVVGDVKAPTVLTPAALARYPQKTVPATYRSATGLEAHTFSGALLSDVLPPSALAAAPGKNPSLSFAVLATATDNYSALVSYGELSPDFGGTQVLLATVQDGKPLAQPRLVVPGDARGGRYVTDVIQLRVVRVTP